MLNDNQNNRPSRSNGFIFEDQIIPGSIKQRHLDASRIVARGDIYFGDGNNNLSRLGIGDDYHPLVSLYGYPVWNAILLVYADNAAALSGGLTVGSLYRTGGDPDYVCVVH
jgi:hypothetical protein